MQAGLSESESRGEAEAQMSSPAPNHPSGQPSLVALIVRNLTAPSLWELCYPRPAGVWPGRTAAKVLFLVEIQSKQPPRRGALMGWGLLFSIQAGKAVFATAGPEGCESPTGPGVLSPGCALGVAVSLGAYSCLLES